MTKSERGIEAFKRACVAAGIKIGVDVPEPTAENIESIRRVLLPDNT